MSRTIPDCHRSHKTTHQGGSKAGAMDDSNSGELFVGQGGDNRLIFRSATRNGPTIFRDDVSTRYLRTKDPDSASYIQLRWQFHHSSLRTEESKDLLLALDKIVRILKVLDKAPSRQKQSPLGERRNANGSGQDSGFAPEYAGVNNPERSDRKVESVRGKDSVTKNDDELDSPEEIGQRKHAHLGNGSLGGSSKRKSLSETKNHRPGSSVDYPRERFENHVKRSKQEKVVLEPDSRFNDYESEEEDKMSDEEQAPKSSCRTRDIRRTPCDFIPRKEAAAREPSLVYGQEEEEEEEVYEQRDNVMRKGLNKPAVDIKSVEMANTPQGRERRGKAVYDETANIPQGREARGKAVYDETANIPRGKERMGKSVNDSGRPSARNAKQDSDVGWEEEKKKSRAFFDTSRERSRNEEEEGQERQRVSKSASVAGQSQKYGTRKLKSASVIDSESEEISLQNRCSARLPQRRRKMKLCDYADSSDDDTSHNNDREPLPENGFIYVSDSEAEIVGSNSPSSNKNLKRGASQEARRDSNPKRKSVDGRTFKKISQMGEGKQKPSASGHKTTHEEAGMVPVPEVDEAFRKSNWESMDARAKVATILNQFLYLEQHFRAKYEESRCEKAGRWKYRPDLKAGYYLRIRGCCLNQGASKAGEIDGVAVGQVFRYREELRLLGIHRAQQAGIDYIAAHNSEFRDSEGNRLSVAVSIVSAGGYKDNIDDGKRTLIYTGQGGYSNKTQCCRRGSNGDQELVRGNLALVNSCSHRVPVRVTRGLVAKDNAKKFYVYDGLYDVVHYWEEPGASGYKVWKFKLVKQAAQPDSLMPDNLFYEEMEPEDES